MQLKYNNNKVKTAVIAIQQIQPPVTEFLIHLPLLIAFTISSKSVISNIPYGSMACGS